MISISIARIGSSLLDRKVAKWFLAVGVCWLDLEWPGNEKRSMYFLVSCQIWEAFPRIWAQKIYETWSFFQHLWFTYQKFWTKLFKEKWTLRPHLKFDYLNNNGIINTLSFKIFYAADLEFADFLSGKWTNWYEPNSNLFTSLGSENLNSRFCFSDRK